jgi:glyoxylase-like metal-dependent hydrolase (beta-lactamase superfamily II)
MKRRIILSSLLVVGGLSIAIAAQQQQQPKTLEVTKLKDNLYVLKALTNGGGGNTSVFITANGVVVVDSKNPGWGQPILDKIKTLTDKPVTTLINPHTHGDHVSGNVEFPTSVEVVAHENTKTNMERMDIFKNNGGKNLPERTFKDKMTLGSGKDRMELRYYGRGHTSGDTWVIFPALRAVEAGDMFAFKNIPLADAMWGGSGVEYWQTLSKAIDGIKNVDSVITGHAGVMTWNELKEYREFTKELLDWTREQMKAGKSVDEAAAAYTLPEKYKDYVAPPMRVKNLIQVIYDELKKS